MRGIREKEQGNKAPFISKRGPQSVKNDSYNTTLEVRKVKDTQQLIILTLHTFILTNNINIKDRIAHGMKQVLQFVID